MVLEMENVRLKSLSLKIFSQAIVPVKIVAEKLLKAFWYKPSLEFSHLAHLNNYRRISGVQIPACDFIREV